MKFSRFLLMMLLVMVLAACSGNDTDAEEEAADVEETEDVEADAAEDEGGIEVDRGLLNVEITLPASLFSEEELAELEANMEEEADADVTQNEDGSITVKMPKSEHDEMLAEMRNDISESIDEILADDS